MVIKTTIYSFKFVSKTDHHLGNIDWHANLGWHGNSDWDNDIGRQDMVNKTSRLSRLILKGEVFLYIRIHPEYTVPFDPYPPAVC